MATSSIFANFNITDSKKAESFVQALDVSAKDKTKKNSDDRVEFSVVFPAQIGRASCRERVSACV